MNDPLPKIKRTLSLTPPDPCRDQIDRWLIGEVEDKRTQLVSALDGWRNESRVAIERSREIERLRGLLGRLEWIRRSDFSEQAACPVCELLRDPEGRHEPGCELAAAIRPTSPDPPEGSQP